MIKISRTFTRPNEFVPFHMFLMDEGFVQRIQTAYVNSGKRLSSDMIVSPDGLSVTFESVWVSEAALEEHRSDPVLQPYWELRDAHNASCGITATPLLIEQV